MARKMQLVYIAMNTPFIIGFALCIHNVYNKYIYIYIGQLGDNISFSPSATVPP